MSLMLRDYPIRPLRKNTESLSGYMHRFFWANGIPVPDELAVDINYFYGCRSNIDKPFKRIQLCATGLFTIDKPVWFDYLFRRYRYLDTGNFFLTFMRTTRFCPICLKQTGYWQLVWELPFFSACPIHLCKLISHCPACGKHLDWHRLTGRSCRCGKPLTRMPTSRASKKSLEQTWFLCNITEIPKPANYYRHGYQGGFGHLTCLQAYVTILLIQDIHRHVHRQKYHHQITDMPWFDGQHFFSKATLVIPSVISNWPHNLFAWLERLLALQHMSRTHSDAELNNDTTRLLAYIGDTTLRFSYYCVSDLPIVKAVNYFLRRYRCQKTGKFSYPNPDCAQN